MRSHLTRYRNECTVTAKDDHEPTVGAYFGHRVGGCSRLCHFIKVHCTAFLKHWRVTKGSQLANQLDDRHA